MFHAGKQKGKQAGQRKVAMQRNAKQFNAANSKAEQSKAKILLIN